MSDPGHGGEGMLALERYRTASIADARLCPASGAPHIAEIALWADARSASPGFDSGSFRQFDGLLGCNNKSPAPDSVVFYG
jgi:hypothetical protein